MGLLNLRLRNYDTTSGRFTSTDPAQPAPTAPYTSPYAYTNNQPTIYTDPSGACFWPGCGELITDLLGDIYGTYQDEGLPTHGELPAGVGIGIAEAAEGTAHGFLSGGNPTFDQATGWNGGWFASQVSDYDHGWFHGASITGQGAFYLGLSSASFPFGARSAAGTLATRPCPPALTSAIRGISNPVPTRVARIVEAKIGAASTTLGHPSSSSVFVTAADDISGINTAQGLAQRLTLLDKSGKPRRGPFMITEFDTPMGIASPYNRTDAGFVSGGRTAGGAREFVIPNLGYDELSNVTQRVLQ